MQVPRTGANGQGRPAHQTSQAQPRHHTTQSQQNKDIGIISAVSAIILDFLPWQAYKDP